MDERGLAVRDVTISWGTKELVEIMKQAPKRRTVDEHLEDGVCKAHVSSVDEATGSDFHDGLAG